jgi:hypothetical protein
MLWNKWENNIPGREKKQLSVKNQGDSYSFDIAESDYDNQIALSPTRVKRDKNKFKKYVCNKK